MGLKMIRMKNIFKSFNGFPALSDVSLDIECGTVHALLGENGAGKTTLMRILAGEIAPDSGKIDFVASSEFPDGGTSCTVEMLRQQIALIPALKVWENFVYRVDNKSRKKLAFLPPRGQILRQIEEEASNIGINLNLCAYVSELSESEKQKVAILRVLTSGASLLVFDEPTSLLTQRESTRFFRRIASLAAEGRTIVLITHRIKEAFDYADKITILRKGSLVKTTPASQITESELASEIVGGNFCDTIATPTRKRQNEQTLLEFHNVYAKSSELISLRDISFDLGAGEILGVAGIAGEGQRELALLAAGYLSPEKGSVKRNHSGQPAFIPESHVECSIPDFTLSENFLINRAAFLRNMLTTRKLFADLHQKVAEILAEYDVRPPKPETLCRHLSGGNVQRLILARELSARPQLIVALYPTKGLDIAAASFIRSSLHKTAAAGAGILWFSEDMDELFRVSDRIMVLKSGRVLALDQRDSLQPEKVGMLIGGESPSEWGSA